MPTCASNRFPPNTYGNRRTAPCGSWNSIRTGTPPRTSQSIQTPADVGRRKSSCIPHRRGSRRNGDATAEHTREQPQVHHCTPVSISPPGHAAHPERGQYPLNFPFAFSHAPDYTTGVPHRNAVLPESADDSIRLLEKDAERFTRRQTHIASARREVERPSVEDVLAGRRKPIDGNSLRHFRIRVVEKHEKSASVPGEQRIQEARIG